MWFFWEKQRRLLRGGVSVLGLERWAGRKLEEKRRKVLRQGNGKQVYSRNVKSGLAEITSPTYGPDGNILPEARVGSSLSGVLGSALNSLNDPG